jgi:hypothetical protein
LDAIESAGGRVCGDPNAGLAAGREGAPNPEFPPPKPPEGRDGAARELFPPPKELPEGGPLSAGGGPRGEEPKEGATRELFPPPPNDGEGVPNDRPLEGGPEDEGALDPPNEGALDPPNEGAARVGGELPKAGAGAARGAPTNREEMNQNNIEMRTTTECRRRCATG